MLAALGEADMQGDQAMADRIERFQVASTETTSSSTTRLGQPHARLVTPSRSPSVMPPCSAFAAGTVRCGHDAHKPKKGAPSRITSHDR